MEALAQQAPNPKRMAADFTLYLVFDMATANTLRVEEAPFLRACVAGGAGIIQLRDKVGSRRELFDAALRLAQLARSLGVPLVVNDHLDVALAAGAGGVHLGVDDLPVAAARRAAPRPFLIGATARTVEDARRAEGDGASYIGAGALFASRTKAAPGMSVETARAIAEAVRIPVVAIGGIDAAAAALLRGSGLAGVAVCRALLGARDPEGVARSIRAALRGDENAG